MEKIKQDAAGDVTIMENITTDELINDDKKQQSANQQNCRMQ